jgi:hypothetical protein
MIGNFFWSPPSAFNDKKILVQQKIFLKLSFSCLGGLPGLAGQGVPLAKTSGRWPVRLTATTVGPVKL